MINHSRSGGGGVSPLFCNAFVNIFSAAIRVTSFTSNIFLTITNPKIEQCVVRYFVLLGDKAHADKTYSFHQHTLGVGNEYNIIIESFL